MKKKNIAYVVSLSVLSTACLVAFASSSIAWFMNNANVQPSDMNGSSEGAYFAYGKGTADDPFGINKPRHLYNLSWLNMRGYFENRDNNDDGVTGDHYYFEIDPDLETTTLDCEGTIIPPIGTVEHPFYWSFNGNGKIVTNITISNALGDYDKKPYNAADFFGDPEIIGLFGVVGPADDSPAYGSYISSANKIYDLGISGITIKTVTAKSLIGIAAGYVNGSASTLQNVAVDASTMNVSEGTTTAISEYTNNLSDYGVVGFCESDCKKDIKQVTETIYDVTMGANAEFNAAESDHDVGWGGSIDMKSMFERLINIQNNRGATSATYTYRTTTTYLDDKDHIISGPTDSNATSTFYRYFPNSNVGSFQFLNKNNSYMYMGGGKRVIENYNSYYEHTGHPITDGTNYLVFDGTNYSNTTNVDDATLWKFTVYSGSAYYLTTTINGTTYYINNNSGALASSTSTGTSRRWTLTQSAGDNMTLVNGNYKIHYYNNQWRLVSTTDQQVEDYFTISYRNGQTTNYISKNSTSAATPANTTNESDAARFRNDGTYIYTINTDTTLYLAAYVTSSGGWFPSYTKTLRLINNTGVTNYYYMNVNGNYAVISTPTTWGNENSYPYYNNGWTVNTNNNRHTLNITYKTEQFSSLTLNNTFNDAELTHKGPDNYADSSRTKSYMQYSPNDTTYFPLNVKADGGTSASSITNGNYAPTEANTGYVIAGSNITDTSTVTNGGPSLIRVSEYAISNINNSYTNSDGGIINSKVYTINENGENSISDQITAGKIYEKYDNSKSTLYTNVLSGSDNVYGLHFMSSAITAANVVPATNVSILGNDYDGTGGRPNTYDLPVNSIDFNLKEKGYINFFSGTYFSSDVTSFFSLHQVLRDGNYKITGIKEIKEIYGNTSKNNYSYIYRYSDGTYSKPYRFTGTGEKYEMSTNDQGTVPYTPDYELGSISTYLSSYGYVSLFNTNWITNYNNGSRIRTLQQNTLYYFEIPMNEGEFCLGSVDGGTGGYLLYLDIGANSSKTQRTTIYELFDVDTNIYDYPLGIALKTPNGGTVDATDTACVVVNPAFSGLLTVTRSGADVTLNRNSSSYVKPGYVSDTITLVHDPGSNTNIEGEARETEEKKIRRLTYLDFNVNLGELMKTTITDTSTDGGTSYTRDVKQYSVNPTTFEETEIAADKIKVYNTTTGVKYLESDYMNQNTLKSYVTPGSTTVLASFKYTVVDGNTVETTRTLTIALDANNLTGSYYLVNGYALLITADNSNITIKVLAIGNKTITINGTPITQVGQTITVTASGS